MRVFFLNLSTKTKTIDVTVKQWKLFISFIYHFGDFGDFLWMILVNSLNSVKRFAEWFAWFGGSTYKSQVLYYLYRDDPLNKEVWESWFDNHPCNVENAKVRTLENAKSEMHFDKLWQIKKKLRSNI